MTFSVLSNPKMRCWNSNRVVERLDYVRYQVRFGGVEVDEDDLAGVDSFELAEGRGAHQDDGEQGEDEGFRTHRTSS